MCKVGSPPEASDRTRQTKSARNQNGSRPDARVSPWNLLASTSVHGYARKAGGDSPDSQSGRRRASRDVPRWLVDRDMIDRPGRQAGLAGQECQCVVAANSQQQGWLDLDRPRRAADIASVSDLGAAESGRCETAVAKMLCSRVDRAMLISRRSSRPSSCPSAAISPSVVKGSG
jgi:hypothetical protein